MGADVNDVLVALEDIGVAPEDLLEYAEDDKNWIELDGPFSSLPRFPVESKKALRPLVETVAPPSYVPSHLPDFPAAVYYKPPSVAQAKPTNPQVAKKARLT